MALVGGGIAATLSLLVLSRVIGDNPLYRLAQYLLVGVALGYVAAVLVGQALVAPLQQVAISVATPQTLIVLSVGGLLALLLIPRFGPQRASALANLPLAILFGVGAAIALVGATRGTIVPQLLDTIARERLAAPDLPALVGTVVMILAVVATLLSFHYTQRAGEPSQLAAAMRGLGRGLILASFGVFLAATVRTYLAALVLQLESIAAWITQIAGTF